MRPPDGDFSSGHKGLRVRGRGRAESRKRHSKENAPRISRGARQLRLLALKSTRPTSPQTASSTAAIGCVASITRHRWGCARAIWR